MFKYQTPKISTVNPGESIHFGDIGLIFVGQESDKSTDCQMGANRGISPALSQLEIRIQRLKTTQDSIRSCKSGILRHEMEIESINFDLEELRADEQFSRTRIDALLEEARKEGLDDAYLDRFMREHHCKIDK